MKLSIGAVRSVVQTLGETAGAAIPGVGAKLGGFVAAHPVHAANIGVRASVAATAGASHLFGALETRPAAWAAARTAVDHISFEHALTAGVDANIERVSEHVARYG